MFSARCVVAAVIGGNDMDRSCIPAQSKGIEAHLRDLCRIYRGEEDNPHDVTALLDEERAIQFLRYNLWDVERCFMEAPAVWRSIFWEEKCGLPADDEAIARKIYNYAVRKKLERVKEFGVDLTGVYERFFK